MNRTEIGIRGEDAAAAYLERAGLGIIERNWRSSAPKGEVDVIALDGEVLVLCEVKTRTSSAQGTPEEAVSPAKQRRLVRLAEAYIATAGIAPIQTRFDVISITVIDANRALLRHHRAAFVAE